VGKDLTGKELGNGIVQRKDGLYCARFNDRFGKQKTIYDKNIKSLRAKLIKAQYEDSERLSIVDENYTLDEWFEKWLSAYKKNTVREGTLTLYKKQYRLYVSKIIGMVPISKISKLQVSLLIGDLIKSGVGWSTQNAVKILLTDIFDKALMDNFIRSNPAKGVKIAKKSNDDRRVLTKDEQLEFLECSAGTFYHNLFDVAVNTGLRPGELCALTWDDVDLEKKYISVNKTLLYQKNEGDEQKTFHFGETKTESSVRLVPINIYCEKALKKQFVQKKNVEGKSKKTTEFPDLLFTTKFNTPISAHLFDNAIIRIINEINLSRGIDNEFEHFSAHTFRHTFATRCIESNVNIKTLQTYLGHSSLQTTMLYLHTTDDHKFAEMELLENELDKLYDGNNEKSELQFENALKKDKKIVPIHKAM